MCDTIVATAEATSDGSVILAKNSDREPNEVQLLNHLMSNKHGAKESLKCTYLTIPQSPLTNEVLLSRPFWMWGCEIGANAHGVTIGNEAVFTREKYAKSGLTGMDLLRLTLERSRTARDALGCIAELLEKYGQGGNCGYRHRLFYHNSFIIADKKEAWVLETAGPHWTAEHVRGVRSISNGLTIGEEFDLSSKGIEDYARRKGYAKPHETFCFKKAFSDTLYTHFSRCRIRQQRTTSLLKRHFGNITPSLMMRVLRDHGSDERYAPPHGTSMGNVCMHASLGPFRASQSTAAMVSHLRPVMPVHWVTGTSATCTGVFKPLYLMGKEMPFLSSDSPATFSAEVLWWRHELLHRQALLKYGSWSSVLAGERDALEKKFLRMEARFIRSLSETRTGRAGKAADFSKRCFEEAEKKTLEWREKLVLAPNEQGIPFSFKYFWKGQNKAARLP